MTVFVHSIVIICFRFLFVDRLGPTATLRDKMENSDSYEDRLLDYSIEDFKQHSIVQLLLGAPEFHLTIASHGSVFSSSWYQL